MTTEQWSFLSGRAVGEYRTGEMIFASERRAIFRVTANESGPSDRCLWFYEAPDETLAQERRNRFCEAMFLRHSNILRVFEASSEQIEQQWLTCVVTENVDRHLSKDDSESLAGISEAIISALTELHNEGLVYCALSFQSVWQAAGEWKLTDFSELRLEGTYNPQETKRLMTRSDLSVPPEAWDGIVSAKWDAWSLGNVLRRLGATESTASLTEPDPAIRLSVADLRDHGPEMPVTTKPEVPFVADESAPQIFVPPPAFAMSGRSERVHRNAYRLLRTPRRAVIWSWVACGTALLFLLAMTVWGRRSVSPATPIAHSENPVSRGATAGDREGARTSPAQSGSGNRADTPEGVLARWVESTRMKNLDEQMRCYAPVLAHYFGRSNMRAAELRSAKAKAFESIGPVRTFEVEHPVYRSAGADSVVVLFQKIWDFPRRHFSGTERDRMELRRVAGEWKIVSEGELGRHAPAAGF